MIRSGVVVEKENGVLGVVFERPEMCAHCGGCLHKHCSRVQIKGDAQIGDTVDVDMPDGEVVKASALMYIVPLCAFLLGLLLAWLVYRGGAVRMAEDLFYALCGLAACALGLAAVWAADKKLRGAQKWQPRVVAVHKPEQPGEQ